MDKNNKFEMVNPVKPKVHTGFGDDPDSKRKEALKTEEHRTKVLMHWIFRLLLIGMALFLIILFFVILPITEMSLNYGSVWYSFQRWSVAFLSTAGTAGIALLTLTVSVVLKELFERLKERVFPK